MVKYNKLCNKYSIVSKELNLLKDKNPNMTYTQLEHLRNVNNTFVIKINGYTNINNKQLINSLMKQNVYINMINKVSTNGNPYISLIVSLNKINNYNLNHVNNTIFSYKHLLIPGIIFLIIGVVMMNTNTFKTMQNKIKDLTNKDTQKVGKEEDTNNTFINENSDTRDRPHVNNDGTIHIKEDITSDTVKPNNVINSENIHKDEDNTYL